MRKMYLMLALAPLLLGGCASNDFLAGYLAPSPPPTIAQPRPLTPADSLRQARQQEQQGHWIQARKTYQDALAYYPNNKQLHSRYNGFKARYGARVARVEVDTLVRKATKLRVEHQAHKATDPRYRGEHLAEVERISIQLARKGERAMRRNQMDLAGLALSQSVQVHSNRTTRHAYNEYQAYKERMAFARMVKRGRKMADASAVPARL